MTEEHEREGTTVGCRRQVTIRSHGELREAGNLCGIGASNQSRRS
jgi:hypothetical protein